MFDPEATTTHAIPIPPRILASLQRYAREHTPTGGFLRAVLANDLTQAVGGADPESMAALPAIVAYVYMELPSACHGSAATVEAWLQRAPDEVEEGATCETS